MSYQGDDFCIQSYLALYFVLADYKDICFTADEVKYMQYHLEFAMASENYGFEPMIFQHMYDRFSLVFPDFAEAWDAIEECEGQVETMAVIEEKYGVFARIAMLIMDVRFRTIDWRQEFPAPKSGH